MAGSRCSPVADLSRRTFLGVIASAAAGAVALAKLPFAPDPPTRLFDGPVAITFAGVPIRVNRDCPTDMVFFVQSTYWLRIHDDDLRRCAVIRGVNG